MAMLLPPVVRLAPAKSGRLKWMLLSRVPSAARPTPSGVRQIRYAILRDLRGCRVACYLLFRLVMRIDTTQETRLHQLRRLLAEADAPDLQSPSGKGRGYSVLHSGCTAKVSGVPFELDSRPRAGVRADASRGPRSCVAA